MKNPLAQFVTTKNLYLVTLRNVSHIGAKAFGISLYFFGEKRYAFAKRLPYGNYIDIFEGTLYHPYDEPLLGSGDLAVSKAEPINTKLLFVSKFVLQEALNELNPVVEKQYTKK